MDTIDQRQVACKAINVKVCQDLSTLDAMKEVQILKTLNHVRTPLTPVPRSGACAEAEYQSCLAR